MPSSSGIKLVIVLFSLLQLFSEINGALRKGKMGNGLKDVVSDIEGGCPGQAPLIRNQTSPNGDSPTESFVKMVKNAGYKATLITVTTQDGYMLSMYQISKPKSKKKNKDKTPVLIMHGLISSPMDFIVNDKTKALPYKLVDSGRDVFLGANRGTSYSKKHTTYSTTDPRFWAFSHIEYGLYDMPAFLDGIQKITNQPQVFYIGHSLGTKQFFSAMSENPGNCSRIKAMWALAPVAYVKNIITPLYKALALVAGPIGVGTSVLGKLEFKLGNPAVGKALAAVCATKVGCPACQNLVFSLGGYNPKQFNERWQSQQLGHFPDETSSQNMLHEAQEIFYGRFGYIDWGPVENKIRYGSIIPPKLKLSNMAKSCNVHLVYAEGDWMADVKDVKKLKLKLGKAVKSFTKVSMKEFNHFDFVWGKDADALVYSKILTEMNSYGK